MAHTNELELNLKKRFKTLRTHFSLNTLEMAQRLELSKGGYKKYETGERFPSSHTLTRLIEEFDISMDWLLFGRGSMFFSGNSPEEELAQEKEKLELDLATLKESYEKEMEILETDIKNSKKIRSFVQYMNQDSDFFQQAMALFQQYKKDQKED